MRSVERAFMLVCQFFERERKNLEYARNNNILSVAEKERIFQNIMKDLRRDLRKENKAVRLAYSSKR